MALNEVEEPAPSHKLLVAGKIADARATSSLSAPTRERERARARSSSFSMVGDFRIFIVTDVTRHIDIELVVTTVLLSPYVTQSQNVRHYIE